MEAVKIIRRASWGARSPARNYSTYHWPARKTIVVHHTVEKISDNVTLNQSKVKVRGHQAQHLRKGWTDIGYHFLIDPKGRIFEGRPRNTIGSHSPGANHNPGVAFMGDFRYKPPTREAIRSFWWLYENLNGNSVSGHRDYYPTACPGDALYNAVVGKKPPGDTRTFDERLDDAWFPPKSGKTVRERLAKWARAGRPAGIPNKRDSLMYKRLRKVGGFGVDSARAIVKAFRRY